MKLSEHQAAVDAAYREGRDLEDMGLFDEALPSYFVGATLDQLMPSIIDSRAKWDSLPVGSMVRLTSTSTILPGTHILIRIPEEEVERKTASFHLIPDWDKLWTVWMEGAFKSFTTIVLLYTPYEPE